MSINTKCQVFTPSETVKKLLDIIGYNSDLYGKKVAENSCGDGNILVEIVRRYIEDAKSQRFSNDKIKTGLERDIYGAEIDNLHRSNSIIRLNTLTSEYEIYDVKWNIYNGDFLKLKIQQKFDFVIGNPPYIAHKEIQLKDREFLKKNFLTCSKGKFDFCYAFIEASIKSLTSEGKMAYLIPSNIFKNQFAMKLREMLTAGLTDIYDFTHQKLFANKLTASAIIVYNAGKSGESITYHNVIAKSNFAISKVTLSDKWQFDQQIKNLKETDNVRFGEIFHAASSIATLLNEAFIIDEFEDVGDYIRVGDYDIEKKLLRTAVSPRSKNYKKIEYVIFPYYYENGKLSRYSVENFEKMYPMGTQYLKHYEEKLSKRKSDKSCQWFEYGRSQALAHLNQRKLLTSTLVTDVVRTYLLGDNIIPTAGIYIVPVSTYGIEIADKILRSKEFLAYVRSIGVISNGNSFRISPKDINNHIFSASILDECNKKRLVAHA